MRNEHGQNNRRLWLVALSALLVVEGCATRIDTVEIGNKTADTVFINGELYTVDEDNRWAEAIAVEGGTIAFVGSMGDIDSYIGDQTEVIDPDGKFALPSFVDSHLHPLSNSYAYLFQVALFDLGTTEEYLDQIREFAEKHPELEGIMGAGFDRSLYDATGPRKEWLDAIDSERPIGRSGSGLLCFPHSLPWG
jgi:hypothetical protein